jgi:DNA uptake protein ComE-like DNA-binding protein
MASQSRFINLNVASRDELASVPMIGADRADELVKKRPFASWEEIENVPGFDAQLVEELRRGGAQLGEQR